MYLSVTDQPDLSRWNQPVDPDVLIAIVRIQAYFRGYRTRLALYLNNPRNVISLVLATDQANTDEADRSALASEIISHSDSGQLCRRLLAQAKRAGDGWFKCTQLLQHANTENDVGLALVKSLVRTGQINFMQDLEHLVAYCDYTGTYSELGQPEIMVDTSPSSEAHVKPNRGWINLLFRQLIQPPTTDTKSPNCPVPIPFSMRLKCELRGTHVLLINNDTGEKLEPSVRYPSSWINLHPTPGGYTLLGLAGHGPAPGGNWHLRLFGHGIYGDQGLPRLLNVFSVKKGLCCVFNQIEASDYYAPNSHGLLFSRQLQTETEQLITVHLRLSSPNVPVQLTIRCGDSTIPLTRAQGVGEAIILSYLIKPEPDSNTGEQNVNNDGASVRENNKILGSDTRDLTETRTASSKPSLKSGSQGRPTQLKKSTRGSSSPGAPSGDKQTARPTASSHSSRSRSGDKTTASQSPSHTRHRGGSQSPSQPQQARDRRVWIEAHVDKSQWPLSMRNWSFLEEIRRNQLHEYLVSASSRTTASNGKLSDLAGSVERSVKPLPTSKQNSNRSKQQTGRVPSAKLDENQAHWKLRILVDSGVSSNLTFLFLCTDEADGDGEKSTSDAIEMSASKSGFRITCKLLW
ncbi:unnamed protein product [Echinostoma caproni]|uniref:SH2 domain-containing protein n=1 Tax=Echinostoma caproni TaxID=27848 RepID=A0A183AQ44_9TREM|nr:unnamed protein product [Echinostoma caproni]